MHPLRAICNLPEGNFFEKKKLTCSVTMTFKQNTITELKKKALCRNC